MQHRAHHDQLGIAPERQRLLDRAVTAATTPGGRLMLVGEPGIGKTFLIDALLRSLGDDRTVLFTRATEGERQPFAGLRDLFATLPAEAFRQLPSEQRESVLAMLGRAPGRRVELAMLQAGVTQVLAGATKAGAAIVVDEWQWLDPESRRAVERAVLRPGIGSAVSVVAARRADGSPEDLAVRPLFAPTDVAPMVALEPASVRQVVADAGLGALPPSVLAEVAEVSGGNPLWAIELAAARTDGDLRRWATGSVVEAVSHRVAALPAPVRETLRTVAVLGSAAVDDLETIRPGATAAVADGVERRVFRCDEGVVTASHPLLAAAALQTLPAAEERAVHAAVAELPLPAPRQLEHRDAGTEPGTNERLARDLVTASGRARRAGATETALRLARKALVRTGHDSQHRPRRVAEAAELAFAIGDSALTIEIVAELDVESLSVPVFDRVVAVLVQALEKTDGQVAVVRRLESLQRIAVTQGVRWTILETWRLISAQAHDDDVVERLLALVEVLRTDEAPRTRSTALYWAAYLRLDRGDGIDDTLIAGVRAVERTTGSPALEETADAMESLWPYQADDLARSRSNLTMFVRAAKSSGEGYAIVQGLAHAAIVETLAGRLEVARGLLQEAEQEAGALSLLPPSLYRARGLLALSLDDRGAVDALLDARMSPAAESRGSLLRAGIAGLDHAYSERWDDALEDLEAAYSLARSRHIDEPGKRLWVDVELVRALVSAGDLERARAITDDLAALGQHPGRVHARGQALRLRALLAGRSGDGEHALRLSGEGLVALRRGGFRPELLRAQLEQVQILEWSGQIARARHVLETLGEPATRLGDPRLLSRIDAVRSRLQSASTRTPLTPAELRVARAAAGGQSNREIAAELFLSVRTVETHLASVYRKIGVRTRTQLALNLHDVDLAVSA